VHASSGGAAGEGVKGEEKEGEEAVKPLSEAELALKKAAEAAAEEVGLSAILFGSWLRKMWSIFNARLSSRN
jgi:hypothetical protein